MNAWLTRAILQGQVWKSAKGFLVAREAKQHIKSGKSGAHCESCVSLDQEIDESTWECWRAWVRSLETDIQGKGEFWSSSKVKEQGFLLHFSFIPFRLEACWLVPFPPWMGLPSPENLLSHAQSPAKPTLWEVLLKLTQQLTVTKSKSFKSIFRK